MLDDHELRAALRAIDMLDLRRWSAAKLQVLHECLLADGEEVTSRKVARRTGMAVGTAERYLNQLTDDKVLERLAGAGRRGTVRPLAEPQHWRTEPRRSIGRELWERRIDDPTDRDDLLPSIARNRAPFRAHPWGRAQRQPSARTRTDARNPDVARAPVAARANPAVARDAMGARATRNSDGASARPTAARATDDADRAPVNSLEFGTTTTTKEQLRRTFLERGQRVEGRLLDSVVEALDGLEVDQVLGRLRRQPLSRAGDGYGEVALCRRVAAELRVELDPDLPAGSAPQDRIFIPGMGWSSHRRETVAPSWKDEPDDDDGDCEVAL